MRIEEIIKNPGSISIDTRTIEKNEVFLAIKGSHFNGHDFVKEAFKKGARAAVVSQSPKGVSNYRGRVIKVSDTIKALGNIAMSHRLKFDTPVIAITGTNGKTTAKDMVAHVLSSRYSVLRNETSKNNLIGLPLTLAKLEKKHDIAVVEMGMNRPGEIARLSEIARPRVGVITNIGPSHLEFLGTLKNVFMAKSELLKSLSMAGTAVLNKDDVYLRGARGLKCKKIYFGIEERCPYQARRLAYRRNRWSFFAGGLGRLESPVLGKHNIYNVLIAVCVARLFNVDFPVIKKRIESFRQASPMRLEFKNIRGVKILNDSYNSNPRSMECALETLARYDTRGKRIAVSGDMLELGKDARAMHEKIGKIAASSNIDILVTLGRLSKFTERGAKRKMMRGLFHAESHRDAAGFLRKTARPGDAILVKGSRAMEMEKIIEGFK